MTKPRRVVGLRGQRALRRALGAALCAIPAACAGAGGAPAGGPRPEADGHDFRMSYHVSCSVSNECRVQYIGEAGELRARDIVGDWETNLGADRGTRLWVRAGAGGCPPRPVRAEIRMGADVVAEHLARPPGGQRCRWILAETEFRIP